MDFDRSYFKGKTAAVTGGASGIGLALCEELLESGAARVTLADFNKDNLREHEQRLQALYPGKVRGSLCDVTDKAQVFQMVKDAEDFGGGRLDLLINCAGAALGGRFADSPLKCSIGMAGRVASNDDWKRALAVNLMGALWGCEAGIPPMVKRGGGQIVNIISGIAFSPMAYQSMYAATKAALNALTLSLRAEFGDSGVKINSATPGTTATAIFGANGTSAPPEAQTPHQSAQRILDGAARNCRLILGDDSDVDGAKYNFLPDQAADKLDRIFLGFARQRSQGDLSFKIDAAAETALSPEGQKQIDRLIAISAMGRSTPERIHGAFAEYFKSRDPFACDPGYFMGKTAAVTGAASGVGLALCKELLRRGAARVVMADFSEGRLPEQAERLERLYPHRVRGILCDVSDEESVKAMIHGAEEFFGDDFHILINCAGVDHAGLFAETTESAGIAAATGARVQTPEDWERVYAVNFWGPLYGCRAALPIMIRQGKGQIVNVVSGTAQVPMPYESVYSSSKAALNALTLVLRYEFWDCGVIFNSATPGTTATAIFGKGGIPEGAQSAEESARRILAGMANNQRLILGDDADLIGAVECFNPDYQTFLDDFTLQVARARRSGHSSCYGKKCST